MARLFIAWIDELEEKIGPLSNLSEDQLLKGLEEHGDKFEGETEGDIYRQLFHANWTATDSISRFA